VLWHSPWVGTAQDLESIEEKQTMYIGPDTLMPVASALAAIAGVVLMFWRRTVGIVRMGAQAVGRSVSRLVGKR
jgi:hypothetical protein